MAGDAHSPLGGAARATINNNLVSRGDSDRGYRSPEGEPPNTRLTLPVDTRERKFECQCSRRAVGQGWVAGITRPHRDCHGHALHQAAARPPSLVKNRSAATIFLGWAGRATQRRPTPGRAGVGEGRGKRGAVSGGHAMSHGTAEPSVNTVRARPPQPLPLWRPPLSRAPLRSAPRSARSALPQASHPPHTQTDSLWPCTHTHTRNDRARAPTTAWPLACGHCGHA